MNIEDTYNVQCCPSCHHPNRVDVLQQINTRFKSQKTVVVMDAKQDIRPIANTRPRTPRWSE